MFLQTNNVTASSREEYVKVFDDKVECEKGRPAHPAKKKKWGKTPTDHTTTKLDLIKKKSPPPKKNRTNPFS